MQYDKVSKVSGLLKILILISCRDLTEIIREIYSHTEIKKLQPRQLSLQVY